jgi:hypothetical protein
VTKNYPQMPQMSQNISKSHEAALYNPFITASSLVTWRRTGRHVFVFICGICVICG